MSRRACLPGHTRCGVAPTLPGSQRLAPSASHFAMAWASASGSVCGGIGIGPQMPEPPARDLAGQVLDDIGPRRVLLGDVARTPGPRSWRPCRGRSGTGAAAASCVMRGCRQPRAAGGGRGRAAARSRPRAAGGVGAVLRADRAVLLGQVAVRVAREVGQERSHLGSAAQSFMQATALTSGLPPLPRSLPGHRPWSRGHAVAVGQQLLRLGDVGVGQHEVVGHARRPGSAGRR